MNIIEFQSWNHHSWLFGHRQEYISKHEINTIVVLIHIPPTYKQLRKSLLAQYCWKVIISVSYKILKLKLHINLYTGASLLPHQFPNILRTSNSWEFHKLAKESTCTKKLASWELADTALVTEKSQTWNYSLLYHLGLKTTTIAVQLSLQRRSRIASLTRRRLIDATDKPSCSTRISFVILDQHECLITLNNLPWFSWKFN